MVVPDKPYKPYDGRLANAHRDPPYLLFIFSDHLNLSQKYEGYGLLPREHTKGLKGRIKEERSIHQYDQSYRFFILLSSRFAHGVEIFLYTGYTLAINYYALMGVMDVTEIVLTL